MTEWKGSRPPRPIFFGMALITLGIVFLLRELGALPDISLWTILWLALGSWLLVGTIVGRRRGWFWPLTLLLIGGFMLLRDTEVLENDFAIWPIVVIGLGLSMVFEATSWNRKSEKVAERRWDIDG